jgi:superoxide dismutase
MTGKHWSSINQWTILLGKWFCLHTTYVLIFPLNTVVAWYKAYYGHYRYDNKHIYLFASWAHIQHLSLSLYGDEMVVE